jgi:hypothetical protein
MNVEARQDFTPSGAPGALLLRTGVASGVPGALLLRTGVASGAGALEAMALEMPAVEGHPNRRLFRGVLTVVDAPSDKPPSGSRGHRVLLTGKAVEEAIPSLLGMAVDYTPSLDGHDARAKIGVITSAELESLASRQTRSRRLLLPGRYGGGRTLLLHSRVQQLKVGGYLFAKDFPEVIRQMQAKGRDELGMSYEIAEVHVADIEAPVWEVTKFTFTGAAVLLKSKAAYQDTWIEVLQDSLQFLVPRSQ